MKDRWFFLSFIVGIMIAIATINHSYLINSNIHPFIIILYKFVIAATGSILYLSYLINNKKIKFNELYNFNSKHMTLLIFSGLLSLGLIFTSVSALKNIPNSGYSIAIKSSVSIIIAVFLSCTFLKKKNLGHLNKETLLGIILIVIGGALVKIYSSKE